MSNCWLHAQTPVKVKHEFSQPYFHPSFMHSPCATAIRSWWRKEKEQQEDAREQKWEDVYVFFLNLDLDSPCFGEEGAKEQHLKACAQRREIYINSP